MAASAGLELLEEVISLVIYENKGGEIFHRNFPNGFHTQLGILYALNALNRAL